MTGHAAALREELEVSDLRISYIHLSVKLVVRGFGLVTQADTEDMECAKTTSASSPTMMKINLLQFDIHFHIEDFFDWATGVQRFFE